MISVAEIAKTAFSAVAGAMSGVVKAALITRSVQGAYAPATGTYSTSTVTISGRALFDFSTAQNFLSDIFPAHVIGPGESLVYFEGLSSAPKETDAVTIEGRPYQVMAVSDVLQAGGLYAAIVVDNG